MAPERRPSRTDVEGMACVAILEALAAGVEYGRPIAVFANQLLPDWTVPEHPICHDVAAAWVASGRGGKVVHGWMYHAQSITGGLWFAAHSLVELDGKLRDVTYPRVRHLSTDPRFIGHPGEERDFLALVQGEPRVPMIDIPVPGNLQEFMR